MPNKRFLLALLLCAFAGFSLYAATVSFVVVETGLPDEAAASQHSRLWEDGLLEVFFDSGHIISNAPMMRQPAALVPGETESLMETALEGGAEYFILALLDYGEPSGQEALSPKEAASPKHVSLRLFRTTSGRMLYERQYAVKKTKSNKEEYSNVKKTVKGLVPHLNER